MYSVGASLRPACARRAKAAARLPGRSSVKGCMASDLSRGVLDRRDDVVVGSATAKIAAHPVTNLLGRSGVALCDAGDAGHDLAGGAVAALEGVALDERRLQGMEPLALREALDCC